MGEPNAYPQDNYQASSKISSALPHDPIAIGNDDSPQTKTEVNA